MHMLNRCLTGCFQNFHIKIVKAIQKSKIYSKILKLYSGHFNNFNHLFYSNKYFHSNLPILSQCHTFASISQVFFVLGVSGSSSFPETEHKIKCKIYTKQC